MKDEELKQWGKFFSRHSHISLQPRHVAICDYLQMTGVLEGCRTLADIGCGEGSFSLLFANVCPVVWALDISVEAVQKFNEYLSEHAIPRIKCFACDYPQEFDGVADVSFLSMTPVIREREDIFAVERKTKRSVVVVTVDVGSRDEIRHALMKRLPPRRKQGFIRNAEWFRENLSAVGRAYREKSFGFTWEEPMPLSVAEEYFSSYFKVLGYDEEESLPVIASYLASVAHNGVVTEVHHLTQCVFDWKVGAED